MALFPGVTGSMGFMGKTHTGLVVSEGDAPAEKLIVAKSEGVKFQYPYGPEGNQNVVIAKGKVVELGTPEYEFSTSRSWPTVKTAAADTKNAAGVNAHNLYEVKRDRFSGNQPNVITRAFIEVPLFEHANVNTAQAYADAMKFGAAYGVTNALKPGDYVKVGANGNFVKVDTSSDSPFSVVGQVWAVEKELPPAGFLQYYLDLKIEEIEKFMKDSSYAPSPGLNGTQLPHYYRPDAPNGGSGDAGAYPFGYPWTLHHWKNDFEKLLNPVINKGIPFLTDGYFKAKQTVTNVSIADLYDASTNNDGLIESVVVSGNLKFVSFDATGTAATTDAAYDDAAAGVITQDVRVAAGSRNNALFIKLRGTIDRVESNPVTVKYSRNTIGGSSGSLTETVAGAATFAAADVHLDWTNNTVVVYLEPGLIYNDIVLDLKLIVDPVAGIPTEWDHAGSVGAVRILLQK